MSGERITRERELATTGLPWRNGDKLRIPSVLTFSFLFFPSFFLFCLLTGVSVVQSLDKPIITVICLMTRLNEQGWWSMEIRHFSPQHAGIEGHLKRAKTRGRNSRSIGLID